MKSVKVFLLASFCPVRTTSGRARLRHVRGQWRRDSTVQQGEARHREAGVHRRLIRPVAVEQRRCCAIERNTSLPHDRQRHTSAIWSRSPAALLNIVLWLVAAEPGIIEHRCALQQGQLSCCEVVVVDRFRGQQRCVANADGCGLVLGLAEGIRLQGLVARYLCRLAGCRGDRAASSCKPVSRPVAARRPRDPRTR